MIKEEIHKIPLIRLIIPFIVGIVLKTKINTQINNYFLLALIFLVILFIVLNSIKKIRQKYFFAQFAGIYFYVLLFLSGVLIVDSKKIPDNIINYKNGFIIGTISEIPQDKNKSIKVIVEINNIFNGNVWQSSEGKAILYLEKNKKSQNINVSDRIIFSPDFNEIKNKNNPNEFDYKSYLMFHFISQQAFLKSNNWQKIDDNTNFSFSIFSQKIRKKLLSVYKRLNIKNDEYAVLSALTLGYKDKLSEEVKAWYSKSGAMHILAVSGLHVGIIYLILNSILFFMNRCKACIILKILLIILLLFTYAFITGLSASVLRASLMFSFVAIGSAFKRTTSIYNTLAASAFILLLINPYLIFDVGFQLSYLAVLSIVFFQPKIFELLHFKSLVPRKIWALISVSIAAQIGTFPLSIYYFHQFPLFFLLTNVIVIPITAIIIYLAVTLFAFSNISFISVYLSKALVFVLRLLNFSVKNIENLPHSTISNIYISKYDLIFIYIIIFILSVFIVNKKHKWFRLNLISVILFLGLLIFEKNETLINRKIIIYNIDRISAYNFIDQADNVLISDFNDKSNRNNLMFYIKNNWLSLGLKNEKIVDLKKLNSNYIFSNIITLDNRNIFIKDKYIDYYGKRLLILNNKNQLPKNNLSKLNLDFIIIANNIMPDIKQITDNYNFKTLIIDSSNSKKNATKIISQCKRLNIKCFNVAEKGAFIVDL